MELTEDEKYKWAKTAFEKDGFKIGKRLGKGGFGLVVEVKLINNKTYAGKIIQKTNNSLEDEPNLIRELRSPNITNIIKVKTHTLEKNQSKQDYHLMLMEKAYLRDLKTMNESIFDNRIFKLIIKTPFEGIISDNIIRFYCYPIIKGLEALDIGGFCHFDIKPENILIFRNLIFKLTDFSFLRNIKKNTDEFGNINIPGGTPGYSSPEYYVNKNVKADIAKKQDYFALGSTIYYLKYGKPMLQFKSYEKPIMTSDYLIDMIQRAMDNIKSKKLSDKDFNNFLCNLIKYKPNERPNFEEIVRDKWLNKNLDKIFEIYNAYFLNEEKLFMELNKSDFIIQKKKQLKPRQKFQFKKEKWQFLNF